MAQCRCMQARTHGGRRLTGRKRRPREPDRAQPTAIQHAYVQRERCCLPTRAHGRSLACRPSRGPRPPAAVDAPPPTWARGELYAPRQVALSMQMRGGKVEEGMHGMGCRSLLDRACRHTRPMTGMKTIRCLKY
jgi:hypothetical protein